MSNKARLKKLKQAAEHKANSFVGELGHTFKRSFVWGYDLACAVLCIDTQVQDQESRLQQVEATLTAATLEMNRTIQSDAEITS